MKKIYRIFIMVAFASIFFAVHALVYVTVQNIFSISNPQILLLMQLILSVLTLSFMISMMSARRVNTWISRKVYLILALWIGLLYHLAMASLTYWLITLFCHDHHQLIGSLLFGISFLVTLGGIFQASHIRMTKYDIALKNLPDFWRGKKMIFVSDFHLGQIYDEHFTRRVVEKINACNADILCIGGDLYDGVAVDEVAVVEPLKDLEIPLGSYFVTGNHEEYGDEKSYEQAIRNAGIRIVDNERIDIHGLQIIGVNYHDTSTTETHQAVMDSMSFDTNMPSILLKHVPSHLKVAQEAGIDIQLSGHTHNGQLFPLGLIGRMIHHGYSYGLSDFKNMKILISSGVGNWGPPLRVGTRSEIVLIHFKA